MLENKDMSKVWEEVVEKTGLFVKEAGFDKIVLGLSGGIDSAVAACIATEALGDMVSQ